MAPFRRPLLRSADPLLENSRRLWLSEIPCWKAFSGTFDAAGKFFPDVRAARHAIGQFGKENTMLGENLSDQIPELTLTLNSN